MMSILLNEKGFCNFHFQLVQESINITKLIFNGIKMTNIHILDYFNIEKL